MNALTQEMKRSLRELDLGLKGELTTTSDMEDLSNSLFFDQVKIGGDRNFSYQVPPAWAKLAYASLNGLSAWYADLLLRISELQGWTSDFTLPLSVWLPGFFNPQSFLTAIMQSTARKNELPLDKMCLILDVTKKMTREEFSAAPKEGAYIHGLFMEVARPLLQPSHPGGEVGHQHGLHCRVQAEGASPSHAGHARQGRDTGHQRMLDYTMKHNELV